MRQVLNFVFIVFLTVYACPIYARDFKVSDFDPADPSQVEIYQIAIESLVAELAIPAMNSEGKELFTATPLTMELVALMTQLAIHAGNITDAARLQEIVDQANREKPATNSFAFILDGDPEYTNRKVAVYYSLEENSRRVEVPVVKVEELELVGESGLVGWALMAKDVEQLLDFLAAKKVVLVVGEGRDAIELDCGFWRRYSIFDLRDEGN